MNSSLFFRNRNQRRERMLRKMSNMRAAKERKRMENPHEHEPKFERWHRFEFGVRDKLTGEFAWRDLVSVRHASKALGLCLKFL
jgi:hypothetical protein